MIFTTPTTDDDAVRLTYFLRNIEGTFRPFQFTLQGVKDAIGERTGIHKTLLDKRGRIVSYGLLRWSEEFPLPAIGVCVDPDFRGMGFATAMMVHLHTVAHEMGHSRVMLHVDDSNATAKSLYKTLGYVEAEDRWILDLSGVQA